MAAHDVRALVCRCGLGVSCAFVMTGFLVDTVLTFVHGHRRGRRGAQLI
jgi:hypothetical protein